MPISINTKPVKPANSASLADALFAIGTVIDVQGGKKLVEDLEVGDMVRTKDNGYQPIRWIASRALTAADFAIDPALRPIRIKTGALGEAKPAQDLLVSPQHCVLLDDWRCELLFGEDEVLVPAQSLLNDHSILIDHDSEEVTYYHFLFDTHQIVYSNGAETESFHPASIKIEELGSAKCAELFKIFPALESDIYAFGAHARPTLKAYEAEVLMAM